MESWRSVWRRGLCPLLSVKALEVLRKGLAEDDQALLQGQTTEPLGLGILSGRSIRGACPVGYCGWKAQAPPDFLYHIPAGPGPKVFQKVEPTEPELRRMLAQSPLRAHLAVPASAPVPSPPLALGVGHVALLLASGH